jgi:hypothetical protein
MRFVFFAALLLLAGCASVPHSGRNACAVFAQRDGWIENWHRAAQNTSRSYGVPVPILMATIFVESGYRSNARPPRTKLLGFIPWTRPSTAYGYSQALDGTWDEYRAETGHLFARRTNFSDAVDFIGWYHRRTAAKTGVPLNDPYNLYLAYQVGPDGYRRQSYGAAEVANARHFASVAYAYNSQLQSCPY